MEGIDLLHCTSSQGHVDIVLFVFFFFFFFFFFVQRIGSIMWCRVVAQWLDINSTARHYLFFGLGFLSFSDRAPARPTDRKIEGNSRERERWIVCRSGGCPQVRGWPALDFLKHHRFRAMASTVSQVLLSFREYPPSAFLLPLPLNNTLAIQMSLHNFLKRKRRERICFVLFFFHSLLFRDARKSIDHLEKKITFPYYSTTVANVPLWWILMV